MTETQDAQPQSEQPHSEQPQSQGRFHGTTQRARSARHRLKANRVANATYRFLVGLVGGIVTIVGVILVPFPFPISGWVIVIVGLLILSTEFAWADRALQFVRDKVDAWTDWLKRQNVWVRLLVLAATVAFVLGVVYVTLLVSGVPSWVPAGWVPDLPGLS